MVTIYSLELFLEIGLDPIHQFSIPNNKRLSEAVRIQLSRVTTSSGIFLFPVYDKVSFCLD